jgi:hypothetical protein
LIITRSNQILDKRIFFEEIELNLKREFTNIIKGIVDNDKLDEINQEIEKHIMTPYSKKKQKSYLILQKSLKELEKKIKLAASLPSTIKPQDFADHYSKNWTTKPQDLNLDE